MPHLVRVVCALTLLLAACASSDATTTTLDPEAPGVTATAPLGTETTPGGTSSDTPSGSEDPTSTPPGSDGTGDDGVTSSTTAEGQSGSTSSTVKVTPTTKPTEVLPSTPGSTPVTDDTTPTGGTTDGRPDDALDLTVTSSQLFVIGGDTLYLVVEGEKAADCHVLGYEVTRSGSTIDIDLWSVPDPNCTFPRDYKDSLALGTYASGSYTIFLLGDDVADVDL